jgi:AAA+ ATPase superfamily predicted ATPase
MATFIGRKRELAKLCTLLDKKSPALIVVKGRRRIGKSRLLSEFGKMVGHVHIFTGLAPDKGVTVKDQRLEFARQLSHEFGLRGLKTDDWGDLFWHLAEQVKTGRVLVVLDEISWMGHDEPTFLSKLKIAWEMYFKENPDLILALCSSISMWIDKNLLSSTGFVGRQSLVLTLKELSLPECGEFWRVQEKLVSPLEKLITLAVTGGIPRYLEEINPNLPAEQNIKNLCFSPEGILFREFDQIFSDLFSDKKILYSEICACLALGPADAKSIYQHIGLSGGGDDYAHLENLVLSGFIAKDYSWHLKSGKMAKIAWYRLSDNYCRFYLKYILPNKHRIEADDYHDITLTTLPSWSAILGLQIENCVLNNRKLIHNALGISQQEIIAHNPYRQRATKNQLGCQIDYLIQTRFNTLYVCEIKYSRDAIQKTAIDEVQQKIKALAVTRNFSIRPVLIHCNTVSEAVEESGFFAKIIDFSQFLTA